jgi:predicted DCC family thiol-disulfide oxidoreductase YuxK
VKCAEGRGVKALIRAHPTSHNSSSHPIILFDGVCNLCNGFVQFVIKRDHRNVFRFGPLQSESARQILMPLGSEHRELTSIVLLDDEDIATESDAVLKIARKLHGLWSLLYAFIIVPRIVRDTLYRIVSRHRYRIFGKMDSCMIPTPELLDRFI